MRMAIFGSGAVGAYFGGRLAQSGEEVIFIARGEHLHAMRTGGLRVESVAGDFAVHPLEVTDDPSALGSADVVLLGVKAWQVAQAAETMGLFIGETTFVVPLQNGVEAPRLLAQRLGRENVLGGLCGLISFIAAPGNVHHTGGAPFVEFGELDNRPSERSGALLDAFSRTTGVTARIPPDIQVAMWRKFLLIAAWSGVGAATRAPIGVLRSQPETLAMLVQAMEEILAVARGHGVALTHDAVDTSLRFLEGLPPHSTASMQRDLMAGRPSELESQSAAVVRLGRAANIPTPLNEFLYHSLQALERRARGEVRFPD